MNSLFLGNCKPIIIDTPPRTIKYFTSVTGNCTNSYSIPEFKKCAGSCDSGTNLLRGYIQESHCTCCSISKSNKITIDLTCDGVIKKHSIEVNVPSLCECRQCSDNISDNSMLSTTPKITSRRNRINSGYQYSNDLSKVPLN